MTDSRYYSTELRLLSYNLVDAPLLGIFQLVEDEEFLVFPGSRVHPFFFSGLFFDYAVWNVLFLGSADFSLELIYDLFLGGQEKKKGFRISLLCFC